MRLPDKVVERDRYDDVARGLSSDFEYSSIKAYIRRPYDKYISCANSLISPRDCVLEIGAGTGNFTGFLIDVGAKVTAIDISDESLKFLSAKLTNRGDLQVVNLDMEEMEYSECFDVVVSAGSLSYGDNERVLRNIHRALRPGGYLICVDSLNNNPIYRLNRYLHFLRGNRTRSTLKNMPDMALIKAYKEAFTSVDVSYFGSMDWMAPVLGLVLGQRQVANVMAFCDKLCRVRSAAFKFVMVCRK